MVDLAPIFLGHVAAQQAADAINAQKDNMPNYGLLIVPSDVDTLIHPIPNMGSWIEYRQRPVVAATMVGNEVTGSTLERFIIEHQQELTPNENVVPVIYARYARIADATVLLVLG